MKLADYLSKNDIKHHVFAGLIGVSQASVTRYASGQRIPEPDVMRAIMKATSGEVSPNDFFSEETEPSKDGAIA